VRQAEVGLPQRIAFLVDAARGHRAHHAPARVHQWIAGVRRAHALAVHPETRHDGVALALVGHEGSFADEKRLPQLDVATKARVRRIETHGAGQLVAIQRQARLGPQAVARRQADRRRAAFGQVLEQRWRLVRMHEQLIGHPLAGVASAGHDQVVAA